MGQALNDAAAMDAYTVSDRGTWLCSRTSATSTIVVEGDRHLINRYDVIELEQKRHPDTHDMAKELADWLVSPAGQDLIGAYRKGGAQLFHPSAANPK